MSSCVRNKRTGRDITVDLAARLEYYLELRPDYLLPQSVLSQTPYKMVGIVILLSCVILASGEHSGAYSSPQYAKKMYPKGFDTNALLPREKPPVVFKRHTDSIDRFDSEHNETSYGRSSFLDSAGNFLSGSGGQLVSTLAKDFIARSTGSSQVLSLNLTNLVILIVLKALILAAGFFGAGAWKGGHHYARSLDDNKNATYITEDEILLYLSYLSGQQSKDYGCLYRLSCQRPQQAALYSSGADLLLQGAKLMQSNSIELHEYEDIAKGIREAAAWGEDGQLCDKRYTCGDN
ncbi:uncharacterized protein LOC126373051 isoform X2 [Pectinophora gossypiella]|uniref:uncharacterized protein LOC126373051 isoform X2 n=1 Tax=Pectinophora gossypiella TaxID=13191 RepID=UPI00214E53F7|nr:uncharacterized protein LOC126373051 isoform X2 [Pectinophora gossypiella]